MKVMITGARGQLGRALALRAPANADVTCFASADLDVCDPHALQSCVTSLKPTHIFNAAAYTAVDLAQTEPERAYAVNATAVGLIANAAQKQGAQLVHVSTDFVFDGKSGIPLATSAPREPLSVYGWSKAAGEDAAGMRALIVRTAWVYDFIGPNFVMTMLRLMRERPEVHVVADQIGTPTSTTTLADSIWALAAAGAQGCYHVTDSGVASWYDFALAIQEEALACGLLSTAVPVIPIATKDYPMLAARPSYSVLDKSATIAFLGTTAPHWRVALRSVLDQIEHSS
jgi:dTDP-4-dehydrorhamnose reductase